MQFFMPPQPKWTEAGRLRAGDWSRLAEMDGYTAWRFRAGETFCSGPELQQTTITD